MKCAYPPCTREAVRKARGRYCSLEHRKAGRLGQPGEARHPPYCLYCRGPKPKRQGSRGGARVFCNQAHRNAYWRMTHYEQFIAVARARAHRRRQRVGVETIRAYDRAYWAANRERIAARRRARYAAKRLTPSVSEAP